ncbi:MAG: hypothetical protein V5A68_03610 [Candidatus Thermoplasmatota archaeon]
MEKILSRKKMINQAAVGSRVGKNADSEDALIDDWQEKNEVLADNF